MAKTIILCCIKEETPIMTLVIIGKSIFNDSYIAANFGITKTIIKTKTPIIAKKTIAG